MAYIKRMRNITPPEGKTAVSLPTAP